MKSLKKNLAKTLSLLIVFATVLGCGTQGLTASAETIETVVTTAGFENESSIKLNKIGSYISGVSNKDGGVAEIISYDKANNNAWVVNGATGKIDIINLDDVTCGISEELTATTLNIQSLVENKIDGFVYGDMTSVSVNSDLDIVAVALQHDAYDKNGYVVILNTKGEFITMIQAGCQPDMVTFSADGNKIVVANEGEPREGIGEGITDPAGSVTVVDVNSKNIANSTAVTIGFDKFDSKVEELISNGIILSKGNKPSVDLEPEYISTTNTTAYIALQEANAIAVLDLTSKEFTGVYSLGYKDLSIETNAVDLLSDGVYEAKTYENAVGAYMPDGVAVYTVGSKTYIVTANEGDAREWGDYCNEIKATVTATDGTEATKVRVIDTDLTDGLPEGKAVLYGGRSFSVYLVEKTGLTQVYDSGNDFESKTAQYFPEYFNCSNDDNKYDSRSQKKGPEAETVAIGNVDGKTYAFVALERISGIMMYDISDPANVTYCNYINTRNFSEDPDLADPEKNPDFYLTGDVAPEGLYFISSENSPSHTPILLGAFEVSGTVTAYAVGTLPSGHGYNSKWESNETNHWHNISCSHIKDIRNKAKHIFKKNVCTVCGFKKIIPQLKVSYAQINAGKTTKIVVNNAKGKISYKSSNNKIAKVNKNGTVTALKKGNAKITVSVDNTKLTFKVRVKTNPQILTSKGKAIGETIKIKANKSATLKIKGAVTVKASSNNKKIAKVSVNKNLTRITVKVTKGVKLGKSTTIKVKLNGVSKKIKIKVK